MKLALSDTPNIRFPLTRAISLSDALHVSLENNFMKDRSCQYRLVRLIVSLKYTVGSELKLTSTSYTNGVH